jgi:hypothetical protein
MQSNNASAAVLRRVDVEVKCSNTREKLRSESYNIEEEKDRAVVEIIR